jgi:small nuclear ribonucleoprotein (snRNP)-like protein
MYINWILALIVIGYLLQSGLLDPGFKYINDTYHIDLKAQITALLAKLPSVDDLLNLNFFDIEEWKNMLKKFAPPKA